MQKTPVPEVTEPEVTIPKIKPIPKYILKKIKAKDEKDFPDCNPYTRFYAYLTVWNKQLMKVTVAVKHYHKKWCCKQVIVHGIHSDYCYLKDVVYFRIAGYVVGWSEQGIGHKKWYESTDWGWQYDEYFNPYAPVINLEVIDKFPEYKYSAYKLYNGVQIFKYLRLYEQFPQIEYLMKSGLTNIAMSKVILRKCGKDKAFCKWLIAHKDDIKAHYYYITTITKAYSTGKSLQSTQEIEKIKKAFYSDNNYRELCEPFRNDSVKLMQYIKEQKTSTHSYCDYYRACTYLNLDMTLPQNRYPHEFKRWHDIRINEYATAKALADKKEREQLYLSFSTIAKKYAILQHDKRSAFICVIAKSPDDLINEGEMLHHCVGEMDYDQRVIKEQSLIFFIRTREQPDTPYVTVEYSLYTHKVLQCYGDHDSKPNDDVLHYVNKIWLPYANKNLKQRVAAPIT